MKATGSVLYLNFKFLITTTFSYFEMLYYEKFVTNTTFSKERIKTQEFVRTFCRPTFTPSVALSHKQTFCHYLRLHHVLLDGFTLSFFHWILLCFLLQNRVSLYNTGGP